LPRFNPTMLQTSSLTPTNPSPRSIPTPFNLPRR
jgi:hypothetical protein